MRQLIVLSAVGSDRPGVVKDISGAILDCGGNIEESRMAALGAEFAVLMLISGNWHTLTKLEKALDELKEKDGLTITIKKTGEHAAQDDCIPYGVDVICLDQPGIVFHLSEFFAIRDIEPMFSVQMTVNIPGNAPIAQLRDEFLDLCEQYNLDSILEPVKS
jgi:glycine cleavage system transcriptional repressor